MGTIWVLSAPNGPHVGPMNFAIRVAYWRHCHYVSNEDSTVLDRAIDKALCGLICCVPKQRFDQVK